ncbi:hypothetical protein [Sabulicella glaciei]|uniref:Uncharacterized protein n=1 Tax=Sabulicella glaciei TaxID=2984948 RepID=A0ABT3NWV0_9PROT|nr:hypothetical protein [Roseococcus sp. MDT2-1-1]MCW8086643.1 hypothetical protein [Roseococcus sp. MDT2-1-1]
MEPMRRIGAEEGVPAKAHGRMEEFVMGLPGGSMEDVVGCFAPPPRRGVTGFGADHAAAASACRSSTPGRSAPSA